MKYLKTMKYLTSFTVLLLVPLAQLHSAPPADSVLLDQNTFGATTHDLPQNDYGLGANSTSNPFIPERGGRFWTFTAAPQLKRDANGLPSAYRLAATRPGDGYVGWLMLVPEAADFRMKIAVANVKAPYVDLRWRHDEGKRRSCGPLRYRFDFVSGTLTKEADGKSTLLAQSKQPLINNIVDQTIRPRPPVKWKEFEILVQNGKIQVWAVADDKKLQEVLQCEDADPITSGAIKLGEGEFGDVRVEALPDTFKSRRLAAQGPDFEDALATSMENANLDDRVKALDYLRHLATPVPREVLTALAIAQSDKELSTRLAALRTIKTLNLNLDVQALLLDGLSSDSATVRAGAARVLTNLKLPPAQMQAKVVDALMKGDQFARFDVKRINESAGEPLQAAVYAEIQQRYAKATDPQVKIALLKAMSRDCITDNSHKQPIKDEPRAEALPLLAQALSDSSAEVRLAAMRTLRFLESPLCFNGNKKEKANIFRNNPEPTAKLVKTLQSILQTNPSAAQRAEAVGCLAEMRQVPETVIAALGDKDASVRSAAAQGLCCYTRPLLQAAIPSLQKLTTDAECGRDAVATLGYIQDEEVQAAIKAKKPLPSMNGLSPAELLEESSRRVERGAKVSLALQAERIPVPNDFIAHYSAQLCLNRNREGANARLRQCLQPYAFHEGFGFLDGTKVPLVYALHYSKSRYYPGTFTPETEELFKKAMFSLIDWSSKDLFKDYVKDVDLLCGTENMHVQITAGVWTLMLTQLNEDPAYASRRLRGGKTVAEYSAEWNAYMKKWMRTRALNGFWVELGSRYAGVYSTPGILAIYTATTDPELKQLTKMFLDLSLVENSQACIGDKRGGSKNRIKDNEIHDAMGTINNVFYDGNTFEGKGCHIFAVTDYRAPAVAKLLYKLGQYPQQPIVIANRRLGEVRSKSSKAEAGEAKPAVDAGASSKDNDSDDSDDDSFTDSWLRWVSDSKAVNYMYKTRNYLLGSMLRDPKTEMGVLYNQRAWNGLLFADGKGLYPTCPWMVPYYCFQHQNVLIVQRDKTDTQKVPVGISFSPGLEIVEENGWVFFIHGDAYAGVRFLTGGYTLQNEMTKVKADGRTHTLLAKVQTTPILIEAGDKDAFGSFDAFKAAVQANTLTFSDNKVEYSGPKQPRIEYFLESTGLTPKVDGKPFSPDPQLVYSSPFMQRKEGDSIVTVTVGGKRVIYDFDKATITETGSSKESTQP
jgi:HEAT repeat protein